MVNWAVVTTFKAKNYVSAAFGHMSAASKKFGDMADKSFRRASRSGSHFSGVLKGVLVAFAVRRGLSELQQGLVQGSKTFMEFDDAIFSAASRMKGFSYGGKEAKAALDELRAAAFKTGEDTKFTATDAANALDKFTLAGFAARNAIASLPGAAQLATVAKTNLTEAVGMSADMLGAFGLKSKDAGKQMKNFAYLNDMLAVAVTSVNTNIAELYEAVTKGAPQIVGAGKQTIPTFLTMIEVLAEAGVKGEEAGVAVRNMMLRLANPSGEARKALKAIGVQAASNGRDFDDLIEVIKRFKDGTKSLGSEQQLRVFSEIFGVRVATASSILTRIATKDLVAYRNSLLSASGVMQRMVDIINLGFGNQWKLVLSNVESIMLRVFYSFENEGRSAITRVIEYLRGVKPEKIAEGIRITGVAIKDLLKIFEGFYRVVSPFIPAISWSFRTLATHINDLAPYISVVLGSMIAFNAALKIGAIISWVSAIQKAAATMGILNAVMAANPIGAVITGIALLTMAGIWMYRNWDKVKSVIKVVWEWFTKLYENPIVSSTFKVFAPFIALPMKVIEMWKPIFGFFEKVFKVLGKVMRIGELAKSLGYEREYGDENSGRGAVVPPNRAEVLGRQKVEFSGRVDIAGAPVGSKAYSVTKGAPPIRFELIGNN